MDRDTLLTMLKADLGLFTVPETVADYMGQLLTTAESQIRARGVDLADSTEDMMFVSSWAAWLYRKRDTGAGLTEMLRDELRTRLCRQAMGAVSDDL